MAYAYPKRDPGPGGKLRWYARIKIGDGYKSLSLRLLAPDSKRLADARTKRLQVECDQGSLSAETREWLGKRSAAELTLLFSQKVHPKPSGAATDWATAMDAYLAAKAPADTRDHFEGKAIADEEHAKYNRMAVVRRFVRWANENKLKFSSEPFTELIVRFIEERQNRVIGGSEKGRPDIKRPISPNTARLFDIPYLCSWGDWMARQGLCVAPDRPHILESVAPRTSYDLELPTWQDDLDALRYFHARRDAQIKDAGSLWRKPTGYHAIWSLILVVRGLGCRPSEAVSLDWRTVKIEEGKVRFLRSKTGRHRTVPILYKWVADELADLASRKSSLTGAVCLSGNGTPYSRQTIAAGLVRRICKDDQRTIYRLKVAQKLWIRQAIHDGFPPHVVARWADHSLTMQERHYSEENAYLPPEQAQNYAEFSTLTEFGRRIREHLGAFSKDFDIGIGGE